MTLDRRSFTMVRIEALTPDQARFINEFGNKYGTTITHKDPNGHSLRPLFETLAGDPAMQDRYAMTFDEAANRINLTFRVREMATHGRMK